MKSTTQELSAQNKNPLPKREGGLAARDVRGGRPVEMPMQIFDQPAASGAFQRFSNCGRSRATGEQSGASKASRNDRLAAD